MFTGLIEEVGLVQRLERSGEGAGLSIQARKVLDGTVLGDSISVSGACLTVVDPAQRRLHGGLHARDSHCTPPWGAAARAPR